MSTETRVVERCSFCSFVTSGPLEEAHPEGHFGRFRVRKGEPRGLVHVPSRRRRR
jgi:hypothetical protein